MLNSDPSDKGKINVFRISRSGSRWRWWTSQRRANSRATARLRSTRARFGAANRRGTNCRRRTRRPRRSRRLWRAASNAATAVAPSPALRVRASDAGGWSEHSWKFAKQNCPESVRNVSLKNVKICPSAQEFFQKSQKRKHLFGKKNFIWVVWWKWTSTGDEQKDSGWSQIICYKFIGG